MGRITKAIPSPAIKFRVANKKFNYTMLMYNGADCSIPPNEICERYEYWLKNQHKFKDPNESIDDQTLYMYKTIRDDILSLGEHDYVVNTLINYAYSIKKSSNKKMLWACFGEEMVENLKRNTASLGKICPICGKRFHAAQDNYVCCSEKCAAELKRCYDIEYQRKS